jgi:hypothetical protein
MNPITDEQIERMALAAIAALDKEAVRIASEKHHLFKFDLPTARRVMRAVLEAEFELQE